MAETTAGTLQLVIKSPGRDAKADFKLAVQAASSLGQVKQLLQREYVGNPSPEAQTVRPWPSQFYFCRAPWKAPLSAHVC